MLAVAGTKMGFVGLKKQEDRVAMLAYLNTLGATLPLPAPAPAAAPAPAVAAEGAPVAGAAAMTAGEAPAGAAASATPAQLKVEKTKRIKRCHTAESA